MCNYIAWNGFNKLCFFTFIFTGLDWGTYKNYAILPHFGPLRPPEHSRGTALSSFGTSPGWPRPRAANDYII